jgi:DNA-binding CsgD family transcriptional regulator
LVRIALFTITPVASGFPIAADLVLLDAGQPAAWGRQMDQLVGLLYDILDDVGAIDVALDAFCTYARAAVAPFVELDRLGDSTLAMRTINTLPNAAHYPELGSQDPWFEAACRNPKLQFAIVCSQVSSSSAAFITAHRSVSQGDYSVETASEVRPLTSHVLRVAALMMERSRSADLRETGTVPMIRIGRRGVEFINDRACDWLNDSTEVSLSGQFVRLKDHALDFLLNRYVDRVLTGGPEGFPGAPLEISAGHDLQTFRLLALPTMGQGSRNDYRPSVLLVVLDSYWRLSKWHVEPLGISDAEAQLANALIAGHSLGDHARARSRSIHTVRSHLKSLQMKLGVHTQAQLVRKLLLLNAGEPS